MKIAAANALAELARQQVPEEVAAAYGGKAHSFGPDYIIPAPVRSAADGDRARRGRAGGDGFGRRAQADRGHGRLSHSAARRGSTRPPRCSPSPMRRARANPKRVLFAEGEEDVVLRAAIAFRDGGYGMPVLVGRDDVHDRLRALGVDDPRELRGATTAAITPRVPEMVDYPLQAAAAARLSCTASCERMVNQDRNIFAALLLAMGEADVMITGVTRPYAQSYPPDPAGARSRRTGVTPFGIHVMVGQTPHRVHRRHDGHRAADRRAARRDRDPDRRASRGAWATSRASPSSPIRTSAIPRAASSSASATR